MKTSCVTSSASSRSPVRANAHRKTRAWYADTSVANAASSPSRVRAMSSSGSKTGIGRPVIGDMSPRNGAAFTQTGASGRAPGARRQAPDNSDLGLCMKGTPVQTGVPFSYQLSSESFGTWHLAPGSQFWKRDADLALVFAAFVLVGNLRLFFAAEEQHLCDAFIRVDLRRQRRGVRD